MKIAMVAGEPSGDLLGGGLLRALRARVPDLQVEGIGGPDMLAAGFHSHYPLETLSVMGLVEVLRHYPRLKRCHSHLIRHFLDNPPDVFVGIDAPDFNLPLAARLSAAGIPTVHYVSPSVWAWRRGRVKKIARACDALLTLFPFEARYYAAQPIAVRYVGHSLASEIPLHPEKHQARQALGLNPEGVYVALLPGSRGGEVSRLAEVFLHTAQWLAERRPELAFVVPVANSVCQAAFSACRQRISRLPPVTLIDGQARTVMAAADVVLTAAGTATLEAMLLKRPMVVAYRLAAPTYWLMRGLIRVPWISLPNLLAEQPLVPEFIQHKATPEALGEAVLYWLDNARERRHLVTVFGELHNRLRQDSNRLAAEAVLAAAERRLDRP